MVALRGNENRHLLGIVWISAIIFALSARSDEQMSEKHPLPLAPFMTPNVTAEMFRHVSRGTITSAKAYMASARRYRAKDPDHAERMESWVQQILDGAWQGVDFLEGERGFFWRGYMSRFAEEPQLYSIYIPRVYDQRKKWPLIVSLHGGSSNHNVWMAMILGNTVSAADYRKNFRTPYRAVVHQDEAIIVSPQGMGQNHWLGEARQDVMDVIDDVRAHYNVDDDRIFLNGLSNGAVATYKIGLSHAWRFAGVLPMSGIVDWEAHAAWGAPASAMRRVLRNESSITIAENAFNTHFVFYHGVRDSGFDVSQARGFAEKLTGLNIPFVYKEISNLGHHLTHLLWREMRILKHVRKYKRPLEVPEVRLVTTSERENRQFWVVLDDRQDHVKPGRIRALVIGTNEIAVETENVARFTLLLDDAPVVGDVLIRVNGQAVRLGPYASKDRVTLNTSLNRAGAVVWGPWDGRRPRRKRGGLSGPLGDVSWEPQIHVYGTQVKEDVEILKKAARLGARGWIRDPEFTQVRHPIVADTELKLQILRDRALVLYGNAKNNAILKKIGKKLPIQVREESITLRGKDLRHGSVGTRFVCPNPLNPERYLVVQAGVTAAAVERAGVLPVFLPDYVVFDARFKDRTQQVVFGKQETIDIGYFTEEWEVP